MTGAAPCANFEELGIDYRILRGIEKKGLSVPTQVQSAVIPLALEGRDITARAHTGTGKTLAYLAPAIHTLIQAGDRNPTFSVVVLVPTSELCEQVSLSASLRFHVQLVNENSQTPATHSKLNNTANTSTCFR
jgi:ATP-dependent RNA helicase DeaD